MSIFQSAYSQTVQTFSVTGSQNWTCPAGITSVTVECWGAGGGSGGVSNVLNAASGGGGGGAYAKSVVSVTPGNTYSVFVGAGAAGGSTSGTSGANGGASSFNTNIVLADGGLGGGGSTSSTSLGAGGNGGGVATSIGTVKFGGGAGAAGILNISGGGGGSSAGNSTIGNNASTSAGGAAPVGGVAGASASTVTAGAAGSNGFAGGGGASGSRRGSSGVAYNGSFGGNGKVVLSYVCTPPTVASTQTNNICNGNNTGAVDITVSGGAPFTGIPTIDQQQTSASCGTSFNDFWQSFTSSVNGLFYSIDVNLLMNSPTVGNWYVYSGSGTGGLLIASGSYNFSAIGGAQWQNILITGSPFLMSGQQYTFRMSNADWNQACGGNVYAGGTDNFSTDRGFRTYMTPAPYNYSWSNGAITEDIINLVAGPYTVTVTDANSCVASKTVSITQPLPLNATTVVNNVLCNGGATGSINLTPSGGITPYTFNWGGGITTEDRTGLPAGVYTCTITDANGCLTTKTSTVTQPPILSSSNVVTNVLCFATATGAINLTALGGTPGYSFNWGGGIITEDRVSIPAGAYTCTITDVNSCTVTATAIVNQPAAALSANTTITNVSCFGGSNGAINLTPAGGTTPYNFNWGGGITTEDRTGLVAGVYTCTVTDLNGCVTIKTSTVTQPATVLSAGTTVTNVSCFGGSNGAINLTPVGGTTPYTFNWGGGITTEDRTSLVAGVYTCTVTDVNTCSVTTSATITQPASALSAITAVTNVFCFGGSNGAINLTPSGGTTPFTFNWGGGVTTEDRTGLVAGVYTCTITDVNGCLTTKTSTVTQPTISLSAGTTVTNVLCFGGSNGAINLTPAGGTTPYTFNWGGGITTEDRTGLVAGVYTCTITDINSCIITASASVVEPSSLTANAVLSSSINCNGGSGIVTVNASGGTPTYLGTGTFTVVAGTYTYTVTDLNSCAKTTTINVTQPAPLTITVSSSSSSICVGATASLTANGASTYTWNPGLLTVNTVTVNPISTTIYTATGTSLLGCVDSKTINLVVNSNPTVAAVASSSAICSGFTSTLTGSGALTYTWNPGALSGSVAVVSPSATTNYTLIGTNAVGCTNTKTLSVTVNSNPTVSIVASPTAICVGSTATLTASGAISYIWNTSESTVIIEVAPSVNTGYTVTGTDALGCINTQTISLIVNQLPNLSLTASPSSVCAGATSTLTAVGANTYSWSTGSTLATIFENPIATTIYTVIGTDVVGCVKTETVNLTVNALPLVTISNSSNAVCVGNSATLTATGANTYSWSTGATTSSEVVSPTSTTVYTVVGTDAFGCSNIDTTRIFANSLPNILTNVNTNTVCLGGVVVFSNLGANTFTLNPSALTGSLVNVPMNNVGLTVYTITGTGPLGCVNTNTVSITTYDIPAVSISQSSSTICAGQSVVLNASGASTYTWTWSGFNSVSNPVTDFPSTSTSYSVTGTDMNGCSNSATASINVSSTPTVSVNTPSTNVCMGYTMTISAVGALNYVWSTGANTNSINVQPFFNTTYSVVGSNGGECTDTVILALTVLPLPSVSASASNTLVCPGQIINLSASGTATAYAWNPGTLIGSSQNVQVTAPITYTAYGQGANGCAFFSTVFIDIQSGAAVTPIATPSVICVGDSAILSVIGGSVPSWSSNVVPNVNMVAPLTLTTYTYGAVDINGCSSVITFTVGIDEDCNVIIYNGFTPNGDGINDFWIIDNIDKYSNNKVYIYNRWGNEIYSVSDYNNTTNVWNGKANGQTITSGTYFFVIVDGSDKLIKKGWLEITN